MNVLHRGPTSSMSDLRRGGLLSSRKLSAYLTPPRFTPLTRIILSLIAISGNTVLSTFLNGALTVALPSIAKSINMSQELLSWPLAMFSLVSGALLLFCGAMADAFGRKNVFLFGSCVFGITSLSTSFMNTGYGLIACSAALGLGTAILTPAGVGILGSSIPEGKIKNRAFALLGAAQPIGFIGGLVLGGLLSTNWRIIFWILSAMTIIFGICAFLGLPSDGEELIQSRHGSMTNLAAHASPIGERRASTASSSAPQYTPGRSLPDLPAQTAPSTSTTTLNTLSGAAQVDENNRSLRLKTFDWFGALMSTSGLVMLTFALADAESAPHGWKTSYVLALLPTSITLLVAFLSWERYLEKRQRTHDLGATNANAITPSALTARNATGFRAPPTTPLLPPAIWRAPKLGAVLSVIFLAWLSFNVMSYLSTLIFQEVQNISAAKTSLLFMPMVGAGLTLNVISGYVVGRVNAAWLIVVGAAMGAAACVIMSAGVDATTPYYKGMLWVMILQVGPDIFFPAGNLYACKSVGRQHQALAGSLFNTTVRLSTSLGLAISSTIATSVTKAASSAASTARLQTRDLLIAHPSLIVSQFVRRAGSDTKLYSTQALMKGFQASSWFCFSCSILAILVACTSLRSIGIVGGMEGKVEDHATSPPAESPRAQTQDIELKTVVAGTTADRGIASRR